MVSINEGEAVRGDVGSEDMKDFTVIGDTVNTAARFPAVATGGEIRRASAMALHTRIAALFETARKACIKLMSKEKEAELYRVLKSRLSPD
jgi:adenylate cyclase